MGILLNPNLAYLLLVFGGMLTILAIISPGTGLLELGALMLLIIAGWQVYNLDINLWALILLILVVIPFLLAVRKSRQPVYLVISLLAFVVGSSFLFRGDHWWQPAVNPFLALAVSIVAGGYLWIAIRKVMEAELSSPRHNLATLIGEIGEAKSDIEDEGSVQIDGELWTARSTTKIPNGTRLRVVGREGFVLLVEPISQNK
jgi:membrane-bound serine protease (ClpP class)